FGIDAGNMISLLNPDEIPPDITIDHVLNLACINLINNKGTYEINTYDNGIYWLRTPDDTAYAASFLLLYTFLEAALSEVGENIVFAIPTRQDVWFVGQSQKEKVVFMMMTAESQYDGAGKNAVSRVLLLYDIKTKQYRVFDPYTDLQSSDDMQQSHSLPRSNKTQNGNKRTKDSGAKTFCKRCGARITEPRRNVFCSQACSDIYYGKL
ncbi:MAG: hypothetical protein FWE83_09285, partial [Oscillospiraceae bacterium]|nr:hypothetical protein [Oscillospiraceae bacterium]